MTRRHLLASAGAAARRGRLRRRFDAGLPAIRPTTPSPIRARRDSRSPSGIRATRSCPARSGCRSRSPNKEDAAQRRDRRSLERARARRQRQADRHGQRADPRDRSGDPVLGRSTCRSTSRASTRCASTATTDSALRSRSRRPEQGHRAVHRVNASAVRHADRRRPPRCRAVLLADAEPVPACTTSR